MMPSLYCIPKLWALSKDLYVTGLPGHICNVFSTLSKTQRVIILPPWIFSVKVAITAFSSSEMHWIMLHLMHCPISLSCSFSATLPLHLKQVVYVSNFCGLTAFTPFSCLLVTNVEDGFKWCWHIFFIHIHVLPQFQHGSFHPVFIVLIPSSHTDRHAALLWSAAIISWQLNSIFAFNDFWFLHRVDLDLSCDEGLCWDLVNVTQE